MKNWKLIDRWQIFRNKFLKIRVDRCELPDGRIMPNYFVLEFSDWVHVVALDEDKKMIMVKQYRHGTEETTLEIPGGATDPGENEDPMEAAKRELKEETGYVSDSWVKIGKHSPNPALLSNHMHIYLATSCRREFNQELDPHEDIDIELHDLEDILKMAKAGEIRHSLVVAGLMLAENALVNLLREP